MKVITVKNLTELDGLNIETSKEIILTHSGQFHAHEVMGVALLSPDLVLRTRSNEVIDYLKGKVLLFDIGGEYDPTRKIVDHHHIKGYPGPEMMWSSWVVDHVDYHEKRLLENIAVIDCGEDYGFDFINSIIRGFNPPFDSESNGDREFETAVRYARMAFDNAEIFMSAVDSQRLRDQAQERAMSELNAAIAAQAQNGYIRLERFLPWVEVVLNHNMVETNDKIFFVISPAQDKGWQVQTVSKGVEDRNPLIPITIEKDEETIFIHPGQFLGKFTTQEKAENVVRSLLPR